MPGRLGLPFPADAILCVFACVQIDVDFLWAMASSTVRVAQELVPVVTSAMTSARGTLRHPRVSMLGAGGELQTCRAFVHFPVKTFVLLASCCGGVGRQASAVEQLPPPAAHWNTALANTAGAEGTLRARTPRA